MASNPIASALKKKAPKGALLFSILVVFSMVLAACGGGGTTPPGTNGAKNKVLTIVPSPSGDFTKNFGPYATGNDPGTIGMMYEPLVYFNTMNGQSTPWLASDFKVSDDAKSITFTIRQNVKWSDGQPFTADDVLFTFNLLKQYPAIDGHALWSTIQDVAEPDASTIKMTLKQPYTPILYYAGGQTWIVPKHIFSSVGDPSKFTNVDNPVGTGPYKVKSFSPQLIVYTKNTNYWQTGKPEVEELHYPSYNSNTSVELDLDKGDIDWAGLYTPKIDQTFVARDPKNHHYWFPAGNTIMLYLNLTKAPFDQVPVRQAISAAINRDQISKNAESGYAATAHLSALVMPNNQQFMSSDYANLSNAQDIAKAQQLMASSGLTKGSDGIYVGKDGKPLSFKLNVVTGWTDWVTTCQVIASDLQQIGIKATVTPLSYNDYFSKQQTGDFDMSISWTTGGPTPFYLYNDLLNSKNTAAIGKAAPTNWERWNDPATDQFLTQFATSNDPAVQKQAIAGIQKIMIEKVPSVPLFYGPVWYEYNTKRFTGFPDKDNTYANPAPFTYPDAEVVLLHLKSV